MFKKLAFLAGALGLVSLAFTAFAASTGASAQTPAPATSTATAAPGSGALDFDFEHWPLRIQGRPLSLDQGGTNGWYFWHDRDGLHIRTTTPAERNHVFTAVLTTTGTFADVGKVRLEGADDIQRLDNGHVLVVRFHTYAGIDGVDFRIAGGDKLALRFAEAGRVVPPSHIFMGLFSVHPDNNPFVVRREG